MCTCHGCIQAFLPTPPRPDGHQRAWVNIHPVPPRYQEEKYKEVRTRPFKFLFYQIKYNRTKNASIIKANTVSWIVSFLLFFTMVINSFIITFIIKLLVPISLLYVNVIKNTVQSKTLADYL